MKKSTIFILITLVFMMVVYVATNYKAYDEVTYSVYYNSFMSEQLTSGNIHTVKVKDTDGKILVMQTDSVKIAVYFPIADRKSIDFKDNTLCLDNLSFYKGKVNYSSNNKSKSGSTNRDYDVIIYAPSINNVITENAPNVTFIKREDHGF